MIRLFLLVSVFLWFPKAYQRWTHAIRLSKCTIAWESNPDWETQIPSKESPIYQTLSQPFSYLNKGKQSYVFISQDGQYVLKLFYFDNCCIPFGQKIERTIRKWLHAREKHYLPCHEKVMKNFASSKLSYELIPHLTGVVMVHLNPKPSHLPVIQVKDRLGRSLHVDPAKIRFVLQKTASSFRKSFSEREDPFLLIRSYLSLLEELSQLGVANLDPTMGKNFGFIDGQAVVIDIGNFVLNRDLAEKNVAHFSSQLDSWLEKKRGNKIL